MHFFHLFLLLPIIFSLSLHTIPIQTAILISPCTYYNCTSNSTFSPNSAYHSNTKILLDWLSSNGTRNAGFYNATVAGKNTADTVYGLFLCQRHINPKSCQQCVIEAAKLISSLRPMTKEAIIWHKICFVRYSNRCFFSTVEVTPKLTFMNDHHKGQVCHFNNILRDMMTDLRTGAASASDRLAHKSMNITGNQTLNGSAWCAPYLSNENCRLCLSDAILEIQASCSRGRVIYPSCGVRYELYSSFFVADRQPLPTPAVGKDITTLESLRFDLAKIEAATDRFAKGNMIGKGGFGEVYKGILSDGQEIAVKRLIGSSGQGEVEFKNEVFVTAKLQHRNLVRLLGFCLEGEEKLLIYEYVPNKSLDYFLFDLQKQRLLSWRERYKIIEGIARRILYLHEDSRIKIIHRDLKPSNVLLDSNMNPKIFDFGMARIIAAEQTEESTCRIVGTYGYISPEYAMHGQFSVKSDVYSFGVTVLEIICGKRKGFSYESECINDIRRHSWTKWLDQKPLELLDSTLEGSYSQEEVIKCIHIGLLCVQGDPNDRPTMATIVFYLNSPSVNLPLPHEPAYFKRREEHRMPSLHRMNDSFSVNEISMTSKSFPR